MRTLLRQEPVQILLLAAPFALAAAWWGKMPATVTTHWGLHGQPDGWMPKAPGVLGVPLLNVGLCLLLAALPALDPRLRRDPAAGTARSRRTLRVCRHAVTAFLAFLSLLVIAVAAGWRVDVARLACDGALVALAVVGNFLGRLRPGYLVGIRTPWTLGSDATWRATHRLGGRVLAFGSLALLVAGCLVPDAVLLGLLLAFVTGLGGWSLGYSAWIYRREHPAA